MAKMISQYTKDQRKRMLLKLAAMPNRHAFLLNKNDITPLEVCIIRNKHGVYIKASDCDFVIAKGTCETALLQSILDAIDNWDRTVMMYHLCIGVSAAE